MARKNDDTDRRFTCRNSACGHSFSKPLKVHNIREKGETPYDACPHCFSAVMLEEGSHKDGSEPIVGEEGRGLEKVLGVIETRAGTVREAKCAYHLGYLSERSKNEKIPEDCVVCANIVQCMLKAVRN